MSTINNPISRFFQRFLIEEEAATAVEYAVMLACIVLIAFKAMQLCGFEIKAFYEFNAQQLDNALNEN